MGVRGFPRKGWRLGRTEGKAVMRVCVCVKGLGCDDARVMGVEFGTVSQRWVHGLWLEGFRTVAILSGGFALCIENLTELE